MKTVILCDRIKAVVEKENNNDNSKTENEEIPSNPKTGDNVMFYIAIASISVLGLGTTIIVAKKRKMK